MEPKKLIKEKTKLGNTSIAVCEHILPITHKTRKSKKNESQKTKIRTTPKNNPILICLTIHYFATLFLMFDNIRTKRFFFELFFELELWCVYDGN